MRTPQENLIALLTDGTCKLFVCPLCLEISTNSVPCYGSGAGPDHPDTALVRVGPWREAVS